MRRRNSCKEDNTDLRHDQLQIKRKEEQWGQGGGRRWIAVSVTYVRQRTRKSVKEEEVVKVDTSQNTCRLVSICAQKTSTG